MGDGVQRKALIGPQLADSIGFDLLDGGLARSVRASLGAGLKDGVVFCDGRTPLRIFRQSLATAIGRIHEDGRAPLFLRFLKDGPYEDGGRIPRALRDRRLTDDETAAVISFVYGHMVNCFKGALAEMLAVDPSLSVLRELKAKGSLPRDARLFVGDSIRVAKRTADGFAKGADLHILTLHRSRKANPRVTIWGIAEVKSYFRSRARLRSQLDQHLARSRRHLQIGESVYRRTQISIGGGNSSKIVRIAVLPAHWTLPRSFHFGSKDGSRFLHVERATPPSATDSFERIGPREWLITLRWSKEALEVAAYGMTFWFMEKVGEALYSDTSLPKGWEGMTPAEAGCNAAKMMLYYAILRCRSAPESQRATALYNSYGFGYELGMNFRNAKGKREMLWPQDLDEILERGVTKHGCRIT